ncbi:MAG: hypothetical protein RSB03_07655 [Oscillospiraceae bacterium]
MRGKRRTLVLPSSVSSLAHKRNPIAPSRNDRLFVLCASLYVVGVVAGAMLYSTGSELMSNYFGYIISNSVISRTSEKLIYTVIYTLIPQLAALLACCVFSYCTVGAPLILLLLVYNGAGPGLIGAFICQKLGLLGIVFNLLIIAPATAVSVFALISLALKGIRASLTLYAIAYKGKSKRLNELNDAIYHSLAIAAAVSFGASVVQGTLFRLFGSALV